MAAQTGSVRIPPVSLSVWTRACVTERGPRWVHLWDVHGPPAEKLVVRQWGRAAANSEHAHKLSSLFRAEWSLRLFRHAQDAAVKTNDR